MALVMECLLQLVKYLHANLDVLPNIWSLLQILGEPTPTSTYVIDDASVINRTTKTELTNRLKRLEIETGYRVSAITVRKLEVETDAFAFADRVLEGWCASASHTLARCTVQFILDHNLVCRD